MKAERKQGLRAPAFHVFTSLLFAYEILRDIPPDLFIPHTAADHSYGRGLLPVYVFRHSVLIADLSFSLYKGLYIVDELAGHIGTLAGDPPGGDHLFLVSYVGQST